MATKKGPKKTTTAPASKRKPAKRSKAAKPKKAKESSEKAADEPGAADAVAAGAAAESTAESTSAAAQPAPAGVSGLPTTPDQADDGALLLEDWTPMGQCLDWRAGLQTWAWQAERLFTEQRVPNLAHDNGAISRRNAEVFIAWCQAQGDDLPAEIVVVELGMGTGLHLRFFLDRLLAYCTAGGQDWYDRLVVYATDVSRGVLEMAAKRKLFADHIDKVQLGRMSAFEPGIFLPLAGGDASDMRGQMHAVFANYVLDLMPMDLFRRAADKTWSAVLARTWLAQPDRMPVYTPLDIGGLRKSIAEGDFRAVAALFPLTEVELRTFPVDLSTHPDLPTLERLADRIEGELGPDHELLKDGTVACHSGGALRVAARITHALAPTGLALVRDVGLTTAAIAAVPRTYSHYGPTAASGVNMVELDDWFAAGADDKDAGLRCIAPATDGPRHQASRMLCRAELPETVAAFQTLYDAQTFAEMENLVAAARAEKDVSAALDLYRTALNIETDNWALMAESARRALSGGLDPQLAVLLARRGVSLNSEYSPDLWVVYGDALWANGDRNSARQAYVFALEVNPNDPHAHFSLAFVDAERGHFENAFTHLGRALAHDKDGVLRPRVLRLLDVCLRGQQQLRTEEKERIAKRATR
ncbi:MAG: hypothetical protein KC502_07840 [Myxococcales bacterium]|nr:hypothetical protein [Myxococcales bacterium]